MSDWTEERIKEELQVCEAFEKRTEPGTLSMDQPAGAFLASALDNYPSVLRALAEAQAEITRLEAEAKDFDNRFIESLYNQWAPMQCKMEEQAKEILDLKSGVKDQGTLEEVHTPGETSEDLKKELLTLLGENALSVDAPVFLAEPDRFSLCQDPNDPAPKKVVTVNFAFCKRVARDISKVAHMLSGRKVAIYTVSAAGIGAEGTLTDILLRLAEFRDGRWCAFRFESWGTKS